MIASSHRAAALFAFGATLLLVSAPDVVQAQKLKQRQQPLLTQEDLCPDYEEIDPLQPCQTVRSFGGLKQLIEAAPSGSSINICPFFVQKVSSVDPIYVRNSIQVTCVRQNPDSICAINGMGHHILIDTAEDTRWQGVSFRGSNDHTVYVTGDVDNAEMATHTFCQSSFINNVRTHDTRGGTFMAEPSSGTINIVQCLFSENYSTTYGAALYSRTNQLNVINSIFVKNVAKGYGGAIFTASGASLMIRGSMFLSNKGRESHDIVYNPKEGTEVFVDGEGNSLNDGTCRGVFDLSVGSCYTFSMPEPQPTAKVTASPTRPPTKSPTRPPTTAANSPATKQPTRPPTKFPTPPPTRAATSLATKQPTRPPTKVPTRPPTTAPNSPATKRPTRPPTKFPTPPPTTAAANSLATKHPTRAPSKVPTFLPTKQPTRHPTKGRTKEPTTQSANISLAPSQAPQPSFTLPSPSTPQSSIGDVQVDKTPSTAPIKKVTPQPNESPLAPKTLSPTGGNERPTKVVLSPSREPSRNVSIGEGGAGVYSMCNFDPFEGDCIMVESFHDFTTAIKQAEGEVVFCGGFRVRKFATGPLLVEENLDIRCLETCTIFGVGPFIQVGGAISKVRFSNMKFMMAESQTAVLVSTTTSLSKTAFCDIEFEDNNIQTGRNGGALHVAETSGVVNVVRTTFTNNSASKGGAIYSSGFAMNVIESRFVANKAYDVGNAIYVGGESRMLILSSTFILNSIDESSGANSKDVAIAVEPKQSIRNDSLRGAFTDAGKNRVIMSGECAGFFNIWDLECLTFHK